MSHFDLAESVYPQQKFQTLSLNSVNEKDMTSNKMDEMQSFYSYMDCTYFKQIKQLKLKLADRGKKQHHLQAEISKLREESKAQQYEIQKMTQEMANQEKNDESCNSTQLNNNNKNIKKASPNRIIKRSLDYLKTKTEKEGKEATNRSPQPHHEIKKTNPMDQYAKINSPSNHIKNSNNFLEMLGKEKQDKGFKEDIQKVKVLRPQKRQLFKKNTSPTNKNNGSPTNKNASPRQKKSSPNATQNNNVNTSNSNGNNNNSNSSNYDKKETKKSPENIKQSKQVKQVRGVEEVKKTNSSPNNAKNSSPNGNTKNNSPRGAKKMSPSNFQPKAFTNNSTKNISKHQTAVNYAKNLIKNNNPSPKGRIRFSPPALKKIQSFGEDSSLKLAKPIERKEKRAFCGLKEEILK